LAKDIPHAANGFANAWQIPLIFAKHWQIAWEVRRPAAQGC
jgi:hypothetical protein